MFGNVSVASLINQTIAQTPYAEAAIVRRAADEQQDQVLPI